MKTIILRGPMQRQYLNTLLDSLNPSEVWEVGIRKHDPKRSVPQSDRYWELITRLGNVMGYSKDEMHDIARFKFLPVREITVDGKKCHSLKSTTKLSRKDMADYQEQLESWAAGMGIDVWEMAA